MGLQIDTSSGGARITLEMDGFKNMATALMGITGMSANRWTLTTTPYLLGAMTGL